MAPESSLPEFVASSSEEASSLALGDPCPESEFECGEFEFCLRSDWLWESDWSWSESTDRSRESPVEDECWGDIPEPQPQPEPVLWPQEPWPEPWLQPQPDPQPEPAVIADRSPQTSISTSSEGVCWLGINGDESSSFLISDLSSIFSCAGLFSRSWISLCCLSVKLRRKVLWQISHSNALTFVCVFWCDFKFEIWQKARPQMLHL